MIKFVKNDFFIYCKESRIENHRSFYGSFCIGPFEAGQSITIANALRRTLLSELKGLAITSAEIEGAFHEYATLPGVRDSVLDILLNLKDIVLKSKNYGNKKKGTSYTATFKNLGQLGYLKTRGPGIVTASDLKLPPGMQCVDPDQYIATLSEEGILNLKIKINEGKNYQMVAQRVGKSISAVQSEPVTFSESAYGFTIIPSIAPHIKGDEKPKTLMRSEKGVSRGVHSTGDALPTSNVGGREDSGQNSSLKKSFIKKVNQKQEGLAKTINKLFFSPKLANKTKIGMRSPVRLASPLKLFLNNLFDIVPKKGKAAFFKAPSSSFLPGKKQKSGIKRLWLKKIKVIQASYVQKLNRQKKAFSINKINKTVLKELSNLIKEKSPQSGRATVSDTVDTPLAIALSTPLAIDAVFMPVNKVNYIIEINEQSVINKDSLGRDYNPILRSAITAATKLPPIEQEQEQEQEQAVNRASSKKKTTPKAVSSPINEARKLIPEKHGSPKWSVASSVKKPSQKNKVRSVRSVRSVQSVRSGPFSLSAPLPFLKAAFFKKGNKKTEATRSSLLEASLPVRSEVASLLATHTGRSLPFFSIRDKSSATYGREAQAEVDWRIEPKTLLKKSHLIFLKASFLKTSFAQTLKVNLKKGDAPSSALAVLSPKLPEKGKETARGTLLSTYPHIKYPVGTLQTSLKNNIILEIWTNGSIHPRQALYDACKNLLSIFSKLEKARFTRAIFQSEKTYSKIALSLISKSNFIEKSLIKNGSLPFSVINKLSKIPSLRDGRSLAQPQTKLAKLDWIGLPAVSHLVTGATVGRTFGKKKKGKISLAPIWGVMFNKNKQFFLAMPKNHQIAFFQNKRIKKEFVTLNTIKGSYKNGFYLSRLANARSNNQKLTESSDSLGTAKRIRYNKKLASSLFLQDNKFDNKNFFSFKKANVPIWLSTKLIEEAPNNSRFAGPLIIKNLQKIEKPINWNIKMSLADYNILKTKPELVDIGKLNLSLRPYTCLKRANINTLGDILKKSKEELFALKNFGKHAINEVEENLQQFGLYLKP